MGTRGHCKLVERSQRIEDSPESTETTQREGLLKRAAVSGQDCCKEDSLEKSTDEAEDRDCMAETGKGSAGRTGEGGERASATTF